MGTRWYDVTFLRGVRTAHSARSRSVPFFCAAWSVAHLAPLAEQHLAANDFDAALFCARPILQRCVSSSTSRSHRTLRMLASDVLVAVGIQSCANLQPLQIVFQLCAVSVSLTTRFFFLAPSILKSPCFQGHVKVRLERGTFCFFCCLSAGHMSFSFRVSYWDKVGRSTLGQSGSLSLSFPSRVSGA